MRIRSIKPEFWRSEDITDLNLEDRLLFIGLWSYVDDNGVGRDHVPAIIGDVFARDMFENPRETVARVSEGLRRLAEAGRILRYTVENRTYLAIHNWDKHQKIDHPAKARYPGPDQAERSSSRESREDVARLREDLAPGTEEQGNRGTEEQGKELLLSAPRWSDTFDAFYVAYPRKVGKEAARKAFAAAIRRGVSGTDIVEGAERYAADPNLPDKQFIPYPATWLNAGSWADEPQPARTNGHNTETPTERITRMRNAALAGLDNMNGDANGHPTGMHQPAIGTRVS
jgi:hypothetical protein